MTFWLKLSSNRIQNGGGNGGQMGSEMGYITKIPIARYLHWHHLVCFPIFNSLYVQDFDFEGLTLGDSSWNLLEITEVGQFCIEYREAGNCGVDPIRQSVEKWYFDFLRLFMGQSLPNLA